MQLLCHFIETEFEYEFEFKFGFEFEFELEFELELEIESKLRHHSTHIMQYHLKSCCSFRIPIIVVFMKIDGCLTCPQNIKGRIRKDDAFT